MRIDSILLRLSLALGIAFAACAGQGWDQVRQQDSAAAYRRFLAENPRSPHAAEAQERVAVLQVERDPTPEALARFRREHPNSAATADLARRLEARSFEAARAEATAAAFDRFLTGFPDGELAARAQGDAEYLHAGGFAGNPASLANFVAQHPSSDYTQEGQRSLAAFDARSRGRGGAVGLRIEIAPGVGEADRLRNVFRDRAREIYAAAGVALVDATANTVLTIHHEERAATAHDQDGRLAKSGVVAETTVSLRHDGDAEPIWLERFSWRTPESDHRDGGSALFAHSASGFWDHFFVPVATWSTQLARRPAWAAGGGLAGVEADVGRAIALAPDGSFRELDLSDPAAPRVIAQYKRPAGIAHFAGVQRVGDRVALFGEDGVEIVARQGGVYRLAFALDRGTAGAVVGVEEVDGKLLVAGTRGLLRVATGGGPVERIFERPLRGIARSGETLLVLDDQWLYGGSARDPRATTFFTAADFGRGLEPRGVRVGGNIAVVFGARGVACFDVSSSGPARALAHPRTAVIGTISDAAVQGGSVFLIGERGLQILDPIGGRVIDGVDVKRRSALAAAGGHVVAVGGDHLEVVDVSPWIARTAAAAPER